jgi:hypothetical protein
MDMLLAKPPQDAATIRTLRRGIGVVALALPVVLTVGNILLARRFTLLGSISGSYYTAMRDVFVGSMCAIGVFLICYRYEKRDDRLSTLAGVLAIAVALFRTTSGDPTVKLTSTDTAIGWVHQLSSSSPGRTRPSHRRRGSGCATASIAPAAGSFSRAWGWRLWRMHSPPLPATRSSLCSGAKRSRYSRSAPPGWSKAKPSSGTRRPTSPPLRPARCIRLRSPARPA